ncbi:flagellar basal body rod protein FlgC [Sphingomonas sp. So64.6b]|uniref:flagellar basal body rod protein FlgC n=1 Tax=Sphingomonas sp. So64.6b TaxID=2997354 RepID=UPI0016030D5B|nr:flagellar basal body rod protein FlgC [Sphingomonas sp. So64.6b]QNA82926.1 flagellar basal body rod protein FlgC [Sphingomonas sp. So64.6b]
MDAMQISRTGLDVEWQRLQVIAQNLANVNTSRTASGEPVRAMRLVSAPKIRFADLVAAKSGTPGPKGVEVIGLEAMPTGLRRVYEPGDPQADADGFVSYPNIDHAGEMTLLIKTSRAYEANLTAMNIAHQMYSRALELGQRS